MKPISLQLYTVREACAQDYRSTIKRVADIGYKGVEFCGYYDLSPKEYRRLMDDLGLVIGSGHMGMPNKDNARQLIDECNTLGMKMLVSGFGPDDLKTVDGCKASAEKLNQAVALLEGSGIQLGIHNHYWEWHKVEDGRYPEDILLTEAPGIFAQLDTYWIAVGGPDAAETVARLKSRARLLHIKDGDIEPAQPMKDIGNGKLNWPAIINAADPNVTEWLIIELDSCATDMMEAVEQSYKYLVGNGLASGNK